MTSVRTGLVLGKFMPLHRGHEALLRFARHQVERLLVVVDHPPHEAVSGDIRCGWIQETMPDAEVFYLPCPMPQAPEEHPNFWQIWRDALLSLLPVAPDVIVASEHYGVLLAQTIGARFLPFDPGRLHVPISGTQLRQDMVSHWEYLSDAAKRHYRLRVCLLGAESTGKTTLARALAAHYDTIFVPEYARTFIEMTGGVQEADMPLIGHGQRALEALVERAAGPLLFQDTDALATSLWQRWLFGRPNDELENLAKIRPAHLYLLTDSDLPWAADAVRYLPDQGERCRADCVETLTRHGYPFRTVSGFGEARTEQAVAAVDEYKANYFKRLI